MNAAISVIIPTHDRLPILRQCLDALGAQDIAMDRMEVIVVADGCSDGTEAAVAQQSYPYQLRVISQAGSGASAARNRGAADASAPLLLFLDDDVIPSPGLVNAHLEAHAGEGQVVAVGPYQLDEPLSADFLADELRSYWKRKIDRMSDPGHQASYRDIVTGNLSLPADSFASLGGFSVAFDRLEDYEFGARLLGTGIRFVFLPDAHARHLVNTDVGPSLRQTRRSAKYELRLVERHPGLVGQSPLKNSARWSRWLVFNASWIGDACAGGGFRMLEVAQNLGVRQIWRPLFRHLQNYWFWRGISDEISTAKALSLLISHAERQALDA